jgi:hypothetical protein
MRSNTRACVLGRKVIALAWRPRFRRLRGVALRDGPDRRRVPTRGSWSAGWPVAWGGIHTFGWASAKRRDQGCQRKTGVAPGSGPHGPSAGSPPRGDRTRWDAIPLSPARRQRRERRRAAGLAFTPTPP